MAQRTRYEWLSAAMSGLRGSRRVKLLGGSLGRHLSVELLERRHLLAGDLLNPFAVGALSLPPDSGGELEGIELTSPAVPSGGGTSATIDMAEGAAAPFALDQTFLLHSHPGSTRIIYLDFDGYTTSGTQWNTKYNSGAAFTTPAYSFEGDASFSDAELERIQRIWQRVSEDYIPFDVDVTTQDPGLEALRRSGAGDTTWGNRVVIGGSSDDWFKSSAGGVAHVGSFGSSFDYPCYVFPAQLSNGYEKYIAEAISHEAGHTLGLSHDGTSTEDYFAGYGSGATGWAPIMGVGYYEELSQWSKGEYPDANETEDDLSVMTSTNRVTYRPDDYGNTLATAAPLSISSNAVSNSGLIERNTDVDYFTFTTMGATINLAINPFNLSPNLDVLATLYNSAGSVIATSNPTAALNASFNMTVGPGTYYLSIDGTGKAAVGTDYGYSDYGSLGDYTITGTLVTTNVPGVDLYGAAFAVSPANLFTAAGTVNAAFTLGNRGNTASGAFDVKFYLSEDATIDPANDLLLMLDPGSVYYDAAEPAAFHVTDGLASRTTQSATVALAVPLNDLWETDGQYYVGMIVDADGNLSEASESNNRNLGDGLDRQSVAYTPIFSNSASISIPTSGAANAYPSNITIAGMSGKIADVNVSLFGLAHTNPDDLDVLLVGPGGQSVVLLSDVGGTTDISGVNLVLDDQATGSLPDSTQLASGTFKPTNIGSGDTFTSPAPEGPYGALLSVFQGLNPNGTWSLYVLDDATSNSGSISGGWSLSITLANAAPTNPVNVTLAAIDEDAAAGDIAGDSVASIVSGSTSTDADGNSLGIAVTSVNNSSGEWQYSTDGGGNWQNLAGVSVAAARLLAPADYVRFVPNADFNSALMGSPGLGFKVWDQTFGAADDLGDTSTNSAFSGGVAVVLQPVSAINDPPSFALAEVIVLADEDAGAISVGNFATNIADGPATATDEAGQSLLFVMSTIGTTGTLSFDAAPSIDPVTGALSFTTTANTYGAATIDVLLRDDGSGTPPNINESVPQEFTVQVAPVNDEQIIATDAGLTVQQGAVAVITSAMLETTDVDNSPAQLMYTISAGPTHGTILVDGAAATQFSQEQIGAGVVSYQNDNTANSTDGFDFAVDDGAGVISTGTFNININIDIRPNPGDYMQDLAVDAADYILWRKNLDTTNVPAYSGADGDGDGTIGPGDYDVWRAHFGETFPSASGASVASGEGGVASGAVAGQAVADGEGVAARQAEPGLLGAAFVATVQSPSRAMHARPASVRASSVAWALAQSRDDALVGWLESGRANHGRDGSMALRATGDDWEQGAADDAVALCDRVFESLAAGLL